MINKQKLWFLTLFSLILVLSIYYITMPSSVLKDIKNASKTVSATNNSNITLSESDALTALRVEQDEEDEKEIASLQEVLQNEKSTTDEKNNAYESLKDINTNKGKVENLEKKLKEKLKLNTFIKIKDKEIKVVVDKKEHSEKIANNIMRLIQEEYKEPMYITVKFQS